MKDKSSAWLGSANAFPCEEMVNYGKGYMMCGGLSKREYMSCIILSGLIAGTDAEFNDKDAVVDYAVDLADRLLERLQKDQESL